MHNPRGFAYTTFNGGYTKVSSWGWGKSLYRAGILPGRYEWVNEGLDIWDRMVVGIDDSDPEQVVELAHEIHRWMSNNASSMCKATVHRDNITNARSLPYLSNTIDGERGEAEWLTPMSEPGYAEFEDQQALTVVLEGLRSLLNPGHFAALVDHVVTGLPIRTSAKRHGVNGSGLYRALRRVAKKIRIDGSTLEVKEIA